MTILDGGRLKGQILDRLKDKIELLDTKPNFVVIHVGHDEASMIYLKQKEKMAKFLGYGYQEIIFDDNVLEDEIIAKINELNNDSNIHGILVQLPLPSGFNSERIINMIDPVKDIDGITDKNWENLVSGKDGLIPPTALGIMKLLEDYHINLTDKNVVIIGKSKLIGKPLEVLMSSEMAKVSLCDSQTFDLEDYTNAADIIVTGVGKPNIITRDMVKIGVTIIDAGINLVDGKIVGDIDFDDMADKTNYITPVPGGVGQMTIAMLACNIYESYNHQIND